MDKVYQIEENMEKKIEAKFRKGNSKLTLLLKDTIVDLHQPQN